MFRTLALAATLVFVALAAPMARAEDSTFQVTEHVDGAGASSSEAYRNAVNGGRHRAWDGLVHKLTGQNDWPKLSAIDDTTLQHMVRSYLPSNERRSTTRYSADMTYIFNEALVRRYFRTSNVAYSAGAAAPMLVIAMAPGFAPDSPFGRAWANIHLAGGVVPILVPASDALNRTQLSAVDFATVAWSDVAPVAARARASAVAVVQAGPGRPGHLAVGIRILYASQPPLGLTPLDVPMPAHAGPDQGYAMAAQAAAQAIGEAWKAHNAFDFSKRSTITVDVAIDSLNGWGSMQQRLMKLPVVMGVKVVAVAIGTVQAEIAYAGTPAQLGEFLTQAQLALQARDGITWLADAPAQAAATP